MLLCAQADQVLGAFILQARSTPEFVHWMRANGDMIPNCAKQCASFLREWCQACPQLKRADGGHVDEDAEAVSGDRGVARAAPSSPPLPRPGPSSVRFAPSGKRAGPSSVSLGTGSSSTPLSVAANSAIGARTVPQKGGVLAGAGSCF